LACPFLQSSFFTPHHTKPNHPTRLIAFNMSNNLRSTTADLQIVIDNGLRDYFVRLPHLGEIIMFRFPFAVTNDDPSTWPSASAMTGASRHNYHPCVVAGVQDNNLEVTLSVMVCRSFSAVSNNAATQYINSLSLEEFNSYIPLDWVPALPVPAAFGLPLLVPTFRPARPTWVVANLHDITITGSFKVRP